MAELYLSDLDAVRCPPALSLLSVINFKLDLKKGGRNGRTEKKNKNSSEDQLHRDPAFFVQTHQLLLSSQLPPNSVILPRSHWTTNAPS